MVLSGLLRMQAAVYHPSNSATAKPKEKPYQEYGHVRSLIFTSTEVDVVDCLPSAITLQEFLLASKSEPTLKTTKECLDLGTGQLHQRPLLI